LVNSVLSISFNTPDCLIVTIGTVCENQDTSDYRQPIALWSEQLELFSKGSYKRYLDQPSPYITREQAVQGSLGMRYYFNDHLRLSWSSELDWEDSRLDYQGVQTPLSGKEWRHLISLGASF
ncbi:hypothetical protein ACW5WJ_03270, partial [Aeromonas hydrophila]